MDNSYKIRKLKNIFTISKISDLSEVDFDCKFTFISKTDEEISLICPTEKLPTNIICRDDDWKAFRIVGTLDLALIGVLSKLTTLLADNNISVSAVSTSNTDYFFVKKENFKAVLELLSNNGYEVI